MKKITTVMLTATAAIALTTGAWADDLKLGSVQLGAASSAVSSGPSDTGPYAGMDFFMPIVIDGVAVGVGFDIVGLGSSVTPQGSLDSYTMGAQVKAAYSLKNLIHWNANIKGEVGYGVTRLNSLNESGVQYGVGVGVQVYKDFGIGYKYKVIDTGFDGLDDVKSHIGYVQWTW
jgi:hypothetical protein